MKKKRCLCCRKYKSLDNFHKDRTRSDGISTSCKSCTYDSSRKWKYKTKYGITIDDYEELFNLQQGRCLICGLPESRKNTKLSVDHDHVTGRIRGLLCRKCNTLLMRVNESIPMLERIIAYLKADL